MTLMVPSPESKVPSRKTRPGTRDPRPGTCCLIFLLLFGQSVSAQLIVSFTGGDPLSVGPGTAGYNFTIGQQPYTVNALGVWDESGTGLSTSHTVGIWDVTSRSLLASAVVSPNGSTDLNGFWYVPVVPLTLQAGVTYRLGAQYADADFDSARGNATSVAVDHGTLGDAFLSNGAGFEFPDVNVAGANAGFFGPNAAFVAVPEPVSVSVVSGCLLLAFAWLRRVFKPTS